MGPGAEFVPGRILLVHGPEPQRLGMYTLDAGAGSGQNEQMRNLNPSCVTAVLAATLIGLSSCSNPPTKAERMERRRAANAVPEEVQAEMLDAAENEVAAADEAATEAQRRVNELRSTSDTPDAEMPEGMPEEMPKEVRSVEMPDVEAIEEVAVEEAPMEPSMKVMGPWMAGDQIDSGRSSVKPIDILEVHANGSGDVCGKGKRATLRYVAMNSDGSVLDPGRRPFTFRVGSGQAISGWDVVVAKMRVGDSLTLMLPQELAYGPSRGDLKFDMELLSFE